MTETQPKRRWFSDIPVGILKASQLGKMEKSLHFASPAPVVVLSAVRYSRISCPAERTRLSHRVAVTRVSPAVAVQLTGSRVTLSHPRPSGFLSPPPLFGREQVTTKYLPKYPLELAWICNVTRALLLSFLTLKY